MASRSHVIIQRLLCSYQSPKTAAISRPGSWLSRLSDVSGIPVAKIVRLGVAAVGIGIPVGIVFGARWLLLLVVGMSMARIAFDRVARKRQRASLDKDLPALLTALASSVRAGLDPVSSLLASSEYLPPRSPLVEGITTLNSRLKRGWDEFEAIEDFLSEWRHADVELFKRCLVLSRRHGSALAEPLHRVTRVVRQRQSFKRKTRAALAMHRLSAIGIALCGISIGVVQVCMNIEGVRGAIAHPVGGKLLGAGVGLIVVGVTWMMSLGAGELS